MHQQILTSVVSAVEADPTLTTIAQVLGILSSASVIVTVPVAVLSLRRVVLQRRSESLLRVIEELRDPDFRALAREVYAAFPIPRSTTCTGRLNDFLDEGHSMTDEGVSSAIQLVNRLNDIAALIDQGAVRERDLHGQTHPRVIELAARLDPFILLRSAKLGYRWGMRVRRLGAGACTYYRTSPLHRNKELSRSGVVLVSAVSGWRWRVRLTSLRAMFLGKYMPSASARQRLDEEELALAQSALSAFSVSHTTDFLDRHPTS
ncbi:MULTISPECIES: hypothetical protein [unclassified Rathayibacter]|uniref:hypothetical protein n=1 Tax=unclassified Rathayibacter TaxID=2609250 RepID=UPI00188CFA69|nr:MULTISPECIES: hypothetical protein [unclassified Rathayibacter]MBF4461011.1 hypothetical protein [Rathayibacter sp. VKM Ac-2879]MBF4502422.1 hypothetical protein [Rathayibacter sp. VKM Ac-2878]